MSAQQLSTTILVLAAGHSEAIRQQPGDYPVCLSELDNRPLLEHIAERVSSIEGADFVYAMLDDEVRRFRLDSVVELLTPGARLVRVPEDTQGSACTALLAACDINPAGGLLIVSANELVALDLGDVVQSFANGPFDAGVLVFRSVHPRYSYVRVDDEDRVTEAAQRNPISHHATTGTFWFRRAGDFTTAVQSMVRKDAHVEGVFYLCPALNEMILRHLTVGVYRIDTSTYFPVKTERQLTVFEHAGQHGGAS